MTNCELTAHMDAALVRDVTNELMSPQLSTAIASKAWRAGRSGAGYGKLRTTAEAGRVAEGGRALPHTRARAGAEGRTAGAGRTPVKEAPHEVLQYVVDGAYGTLTWRLE
ncbi:hypothetical protein GCM10009799_11470 [Nocardiopsis rhodophaea]|uniref:Transposase n=1 Tax=Nocardiopsis rhodophaea TaxID=280238 RepID=A0ABN2SIZ8_9ACTN